MSIETYRNLPLGVQEKIKAIWRENKRDEKMENKECKVWEKLNGIVDEFIPFIDKNKKTYGIYDFFYDCKGGLEKYEFSFLLVKNYEDSMNISENPHFPFIDNFNRGDVAGDKPYVIMRCKKLSPVRLNSRRDAQKIIKMLKKFFGYDA